MIGSKVLRYVSGSIALIAASVWNPTDISATAHFSGAPTFLTEAETLYLDRKQSLSVCIDPQWMPYEAIDENGEHVGISSDYIALIAHSLGIEMKLQQTESWKDSLQRAKDRRCDILAMARATDKRRAFLDFSKPYVSFPYVVVSKKETPDIGVLSDHIGQRFAVVEGYAVNEYLRDKFPGIRILSVENIAEGFAKVLSGEVDGYVDSSVTLDYYINKYNIEGLKTGGETYYNSFLSIASRNDEPMLESIMEKALERISGVDKRAIHRKWIKARR